MMSARWRAKEGKHYYYINDQMKIKVSKDMRDLTSINRYNARNYFFCKKDARAILAFFTGILFGGPEEADRKLSINH